MKIICTCLPARGHFHPMVPIARSLQTAGHELIFATARDLHSDVTAAGFEVVDAGVSVMTLLQAVEDKQGTIGLPPGKRAALMFAEIAPRRLRDTLLPLARDWKPDLLLHEETEYCAPLVASQVGIPSVLVGWPSPARSPQVLRQLHRVLVEFWNESGCAPSRIGALFRHLFLDSCPPSLQAPHVSALGSSLLVRPEPFTNAREKPLPDEIRKYLVKPLVHVSFGTVPIYNEARLYETVIEGLATEDFNVIISVGDNNDPKQFGTHCDNIFISRYISHAALLGHCDVVFCHGGCGSTISALCAGLPLLITPLGGGAQIRNANACSKAGAARVLSVTDFSPHAVRTNIRKLLINPHYRRAAKRIAAEINEMPHARLAVPVLERLAATKKT